MLFQDGFEAGRLLASRLRQFAHQSELRVLPCGGVPVAYEVAKYLSGALEVLIVRKLGTPGQEGMRLLVGVDGALTLALPARNRGVALPGRIIGSRLVFRAISNLALANLFGLVRRPRAIRFQKTVTIHEPVERVFELWSNPENFSRIRSDVQEVKKTGDGPFRWTVSVPLGTSATWESRITEFKPSRLLVWWSVPDTLIRNAGIIRFQSTNDGGTRVYVQMSNKLPGDAVGHELATEPSWGTLSCGQS